MGTCVICGTEVDGHVCASHEEDVYFEFTGTKPDQLGRNRFYLGTVDGYADFGVFVDIGERVTGLLHRSELDRRLESLDWEPGDEVFVQVTNVRDNGNVDLGWSIRQARAEFRGGLVHTPQGDEPLDDAGDGDEVETTADEGAASGDGAEPGSAPGRTTRGGSSPEPPESTEPTGRDEAADRDPEPSGAEGSAGGGGASTAAAGGAEAAAVAGGGGAAVESPLKRSEIAGLEETIGSPVRLEGEVVEARQTGGPTIFELRDETGVVDCAAFESAGVRAYPEVEAGAIVRLDGVVEERRGAVQVETESLVVLEGEEREAVVDRLERALDERARPDDVDLLADHPAVEAVREGLHEAATAVRRAVFEARPVVIRHSNTADGYVAAAAIERAVLPLVRAEHEEGDAEYHYVDRRPLDGRVYGLADAMRDVTRLLDARERHGEKVPLFVFVAAGSTAESVDALDLLGVYGAARVVVDAGYPDTAPADAVETFVSPHRVEAADAETATTTALCANLAAAVNPDVLEELRHLPAISYWRDAPAAYVELAAAAGVDAEETTALREAVALEAFYQAYQDKRELVADLLFGDAALAGPASEQFRTRLDEELRTAEPHLETWSVAGASLGVLDVDAYTHRYDFPPADVLLAALADRAGDLDAVVGVDADELTVWSREPVDLRAVADAVSEAAPDAGVETRGGRDGSLVFLSGERDAVLEATIQAVAEQL